MKLFGPESVLLSLRIWRCDGGGGDDDDDDDCFACYEFHCKHIVRQIGFDQLHCRRTIAPSAAPFKQKLTLNSQSHYSGPLVDVSLVYVMQFCFLARNVNCSRRRLELLKCFFLLLRAPSSPKKWHNNYVGNS